MSEEAAKMTGGEIAASLRSSQRRDTLAVIIRKSDRRSNKFFSLRAKRSKLNWNPHSGPPFTPSTLVECSHKLKTLEFTGLVMRSFYFTSQHRAEN